MKKFISILAVSALIVSNITISEASAGKKNDEAAAAIAGVIALGLLGAAAASHQHDQDYEEYRPHPRFHPDENAVGTCMHHAKRLVKNAGGHHTRLNNVNKIEAKPNGRTVVVFHATGYYDFGRKKSKVRCVVKNHRIVNFKFN